MADLPKPQKMSAKPAALSLKTVQEGASPPVFLRGVRYFLRNRVVAYSEPDPTHLEAQVSGSGTEPYTVAITLETGGFQSNCSCP